MKWIGLTGGIATGKSTATGILRELGFDVVDADRLARDAVAPGSSGLAEVAREFGPGVLTAGGALDRKALGALVFADAGARARLETIVHPRVRALCREHRERLAAAGRALAFYDVPLLFEKNMDADFDMTIAVLCSPETQRARLMARDGLSSAQADARIAAQLSLAEKARRASLVVRNDGTPEELRSALVAALGGL